MSNKYEVVSDGTPQLKRIRGVGKGPLPKPLRGKFTSEKEAIKAIEFYEAMKGTKDGKANVSGTD